MGATRSWAASRHDHVESCPECRARQQRERQYLERLRGAAVPEASEDLTARLLARTEKLAAERTDTTHSDYAHPGRAESERLPAEHSAPDRAGGARTAGPFAGRPAAAAPVPLQGARRRSPRLPALAAGGAVAALALVAGTAYFMGGDAVVPADATSAAALARPDASGLPAAGEPLGAGDLSGASGSGSADAPGAAGSAPRVGFGPGGEPDFTPAGTLSAGQLAAFRSQGWTCPELQELGYHLIWARAGVFSGDEVLELRLTDGQHFATVLEQHVPPQGTPGLPPAPARDEASPINVLTGHAAAVDGFTLVRTGSPSPRHGPGDGALWVNPGPPYRAIYQTSTATYTYISEVSAEQADDAVAALTRVSSGAPVSKVRDGIPERIERGLGRILEHLAP